MLTDEMKQLIATTRLCFAATVNTDGTPNLSPKATLMALDDRRIAFANIASPTTIANLKRNPAIEINIVDIFRRRGYRFAGKAALAEPGAAEFETVAGKLWASVGRDYPVHQVVVVTVERALPVLSPAYTFGGASEDELIPLWQANYGVRPAE